MKKILAALLVLALVAPAMADVAITSSFDNVSKNLTISFAPTAASVRGVAVTVTVTGAAVDAYVSSSFNTFVDYAFMNPSTYTIDMVGQHPLALETAAGVATLPIASGTPFAVSVGYLDEAGAQAGLTTAGTVAVLHLASINPAGGTIAVAANATRGGAVVGDTIGAVTVTGTTIPVQDAITGPAVVTKTTAAPAIGTRVNSGRPETFSVSGVTGSSAIEYQFTFGDGATSAWSTETTATNTYTYAAATAYNVTVQARLVSNPAMSVTSDALALTSEAVKSTSTTIYAAWATWNRPICWGYQKQCNGDVNGLSALSKPVTLADLTIFKAAYDKTDAQLLLVANGICADLNHASSLSKRVTLADLTTFKLYYDKAAASVPVCGLTYLHYYTN